MQEAPPGRDDGRLRTAAAVVAGSLVLALLGGAWLLGPSGGQAPTPVASAPHVAQPPRVTTDPSVLRVQALDTLLEERGAAVLARDREQWLATVDAGSGDFRRRQEAVFDNLREVPLAGWDYEYAGEGPALSEERSSAVGPDAWVARVVLVYRFDGDVGPGEIRREAHLTLVRRGERWLVADDTDGPTSPDLWDLGPVHVVRGERSLVLGNAESAELERYADETDVAARRVDDVWGTDWPRTVVVLVPRSQEDMSRLLLRDDDAGLEQIAAVTTGEVAVDDSTSSTDRMIVNPEGFAQLGDLGRQVVMTHEIAHVATRAVSSTDVPIWLSEGFADYVAYHDTGVSRAVVAQDVLDQVRAGQAPTALPEAADFDPRRGTVAPAYSGAWLAADLVARTWGQERLVALYRAVAAGTPVEAALPEHLGVDEATFTEQWRAYLEQVAS